MKADLTLITLQNTEGKKIKFQEVKKYLGYLVSLFVPVVNVNISNDLQEAWIIVNNKHTGFLLHLMEQSTFFNNFQITASSLDAKKIPHQNLKFSLN
jgi:hypothetical protein